MKHNQGSANETHRKKFLRPAAVNKANANLSPEDAVFKSDLDYDGYRTVVESDNNAYESLAAEREDEVDGDLEIEDREENADLGEEDALDPQGNRQG